MKNSITIFFLCVVFFTLRSDNNEPKKVPGRKRLDSIDYAQLSDEDRKKYLKSLNDKPDSFFAERSAIKKRIIEQFKTELEKENF